MFANTTPNAEWTCPTRGSFLMEARRRHSVLIKHLPVLTFSFISCRVISCGQYRLANVSYTGSRFRTMLLLANISFIAFLLWREGTSLRLTLCSSTVNTFTLTRRRRRTDLGRDQATVRVKRIVL
ncbi:hypothetical protein F2P81_022182 [Scophthalmus maximus]|uniref:Uncharacterized protein n=1 Tax=Scophthalmus maximus TaxID=52904 RepID=A0A6A4S2A4_SCOMX|nr:hypothetical protein F2P81_022182 [Scophthalmus maximus]